MPIIQFTIIMARQHNYGDYINDKCTSTEYNSGKFQRHWQRHIDQKIQQNCIAQEIAVLIYGWAVKGKKRKRNNKKTNNKDKMFNLINHIIFDFHRRFYRRRVAVHAVGTIFILVCRRHRWMWSFSLLFYFLFIVVVVKKAFKLSRYFIASRRKTANSFLFKCNIFLDAFTKFTGGKKRSVPWFVKYHLNTLAVH